MTTKITITKAWVAYAAGAANKFVQNADVKKGIYTFVSASAPADTDIGVYVPPLGPYLAIIPAGENLYIRRQLPNYNAETHVVMLEDA